MRMTINQLISRMTLFSNKPNNIKIKDPNGTAFLIGSCQGERTLNFFKIRLIIKRNNKKYVFYKLTLKYQIIFGG